MAKKAMNLNVYLRSDDVRLLEQKGEDPAAYVRALVRRALDRLKATNA